MSIFLGGDDFQGAVRGGDPFGLQDLDSAEGTHDSGVFSRRGLELAPKQAVEEVAEHRQRGPWDVRRINEKLRFRFKDRWRHQSGLNRQPISKLATVEGDAGRIFVPSRRLPGASVAVG